MTDRDMKTHPYTQEERRGVDYLIKATCNMVGAGPDPIGFLIASHGALVHELKHRDMIAKRGVIHERENTISELERTIEWLREDVHRTTMRRLDLDEEIADHDIGFNLRWDADMRAIKRWQAETGRDLVWPDHADMVVWLLNKLDEICDVHDKLSIGMADKVDQITKQRDIAEAFVVGMVGPKYQPASGELQDILRRARASRDAPRWEDEKL